MGRRQRAPKPVETPDEEDSAENENCFIIPFDANGSHARQDDAAIALPRHPSAQWDIEDGPALRLQACAAALKKCLDRMQDVLAQLRAKTVEDIHEFVAKDHRDANPLMPQLETPAVVVSGSDPGLVKDIMDDLCERLQQDEFNKIAHLHAADCNNVTGALKTLVGGCLRNMDSHGSSSSDLVVLRSWLQTHDEDTRIRVVVLFHDVEMFDAQVLQELFGICSLYADIPFVYCLGTSARSDFLRACLPRATLASLHIRKFVMSQTSTAVFETLIRKLFFDPEFSPDVMLGPAAFELLLDEVNRFNASIDFLRSTLRLIHMHHFAEPLTTFCLDELLGETDGPHAARLLEHADSVGFRERLLASLDLTPNSGHTCAELLRVVSGARTDFAEKTQALRIAFNLLEVIQTSLREQQARSAEVRYGFGHLVQLCLSGTLDKTVKELCALIPKLSTEQLRSLLGQVNAFFYNLPSHIRNAEPATRTRIVEERARLSAATTTEEARVVAGDVGGWLHEYLSERLVKLDELPLYNAWCTGHTTCSPELLNANPRASMLASLISPQHVAPPDDEPEQQRAAPFPDTSVLFRRYLDSGKLINIHDWYQSFAVGLPKPDAPAAREADEEEEDESDAPSSPKRRKRGSRVSKSPKKKKPKASAAKWSEADPAEWEAETKARFLRSYHELEYLGFIRHTRRKAEHVQRTVFEVPPDDERGE